MGLLHQREENPVRDILKLRILMVRKIQMYNEVCVSTTHKIS